MLKRILSLLAAMAMLMGCAAAETVAAPETEAHQIEKKN